MKLTLLGSWPRQVVQWQTNRHFENHLCVIIRELIQMAVETLVYSLFNHLTRLDAQKTYGIQSPRKLQIIRSATEVTCHSLSVNLLAPEFFLNFNTSCILNVNNTGTKYVRIMKQTAFWREREKKRRVYTMFKIFSTYIC